LKAHCVPGPKSPKRISAKVAAVPPPILKDAFEFYSLLKDDELASASVREHLGFLSQELAMNFSIERSVDKLLDCDLNSNAATELRKLRKRFCDRGHADTRIAGGQIPKKSRSIRIARHAEVSTGFNIHDSSGKVPAAAVDTHSKAPKERKKSRASRHVKKSVESVVQLRPHSRSVRSVRKTPARNSGSSSSAH